jgi:hypothetical protein
MNMLDKYITEIGKKLPQKNRLDLQTEIRSTIEDMLEDRSKKTGRSIDNKMIEEVLQEYGSPAKVAASYHTPHYLIGPQLYPFFIIVVKIVLVVLLAVTLGGFLLNYYTNLAGPGFLKALGDFALQFFGGAIAAFGNIVLVFAILERVLPSAEFDEKNEPWKASDLNLEPDPDQISRGEMIFEIVFTVLGLLLINLYPRLVDILIISDHSWAYIPALSPVFTVYLPWINLLGILSLVLDVYLMRQGLWQVVTRIISLVIEVAGIILAGVMLTGPSLLQFSATDLAGTPAAGSAETLTQMVNLAPKIILAILIIVQSVEVVLALLRIARKNMAAVRFIPKS